MRDNKTEDFTSFAKFISFDFTINNARVSIVPHTFPIKILVLDNRCGCICHEYPCVGSGMLGIACTISHKMKHL